MPSNSLSSLSGLENPAMYMLAPTSLFNNIFPEVGTLSGFYKIHNKLFKSLHISHVTVRTIYINITVCLHSGCSHNYDMMILYVTYRYCMF